MAHALKLTAWVALSSTATGQVNFFTSGISVKDLQKAGPGISTTPAVHTTTGDFASKYKSSTDAPTCGSGWWEGGWIGSNEGSGATAESEDDCLRYFQDKFQDNFESELYVNWDPKSHNCYAKQLGSQPIWNPKSNPVFYSIRLCHQSRRPDGVAEVIDSGFFDADRLPDGPFDGNGNPDNDNHDVFQPAECRDGDTKPKGDGCNTCMCVDGTWKCTLMLCPPESDRRCKCGEDCRMASGAHGVCQEDGVTCALNIRPPNCPRPDPRPCSVCPEDVKVFALCPSKGNEDACNREPGCGWCEEQKECRVGCTCDDNEAMSLFQQCRYDSNGEPRNNVPAWPFHTKDARCQCKDSNQDHGNHGNHGNHDDDLRPDDHASRPQIPCIADEDCLQHPHFVNTCPMFCVEGVCAPWHKPFPKPLTVRTGLPLDHTRFKLREESELESVYSNAQAHFPKMMVEGKFFEAVQGAKELVEVKYSEDFLKFSKVLEDPREPGSVPGAKEEPASTGETEYIPGVANTQGYNDAGTSNTNQIFGSVRNLLAIQNQGVNRVHVGTAGARSYPWRMNGRLSMGCTAALIGNRVLLTAAHCVWDKETNSWASFPTFSAGQDGAEKPFGSKQVWRMTIPAGYMSCSTNNDCRAHDWAVLVLRQDQALSVGYFGFSNVKDGQLNLAGYPQSKNRELWYDNCPLHSDEGAWIKHRCDTEPGNSGSAIYKIKNGNRYVVAVHGGGYTDRWNRGADVNGRTSSAGRLYDRMLAERMRYG